MASLKDYKIKPGDLLGIQLCKGSYSWLLVMAAQPLDNAKHQWSDRMECDGLNQDGILVTHVVVSRFWGDLHFPRKAA